MRVIIQPGPLAGELRAVPSKSQAHRLLICAALADRPTVLECGMLNKDIEATASCLQAMGAEVQYRCGAFRIVPIRTAPRGAVLDCGESGSTLRFLLPVVCALGGRGASSCGADCRNGPSPPCGRNWNGTERCSAGPPGMPSLSPGDWDRALIPFPGISPPSISAACSLPCPCWKGRAY